jgi:hypothetical protein
LQYLWIPEGKSVAWEDHHGINRGSRQEKQEMKNYVRLYSTQAAAAIPIPARMVNKLAGDFVADGRGAAAAAAGCDATLPVTDTVVTAAGDDDAAVEVAETNGVVIETDPDDITSGTGNWSFVISTLSMV